MWVLAVIVAWCWAALYLGSARRQAGELGFPLDDAWIHARIATNLRDGAGLTFNPGEKSAASSAPLWSMLLALPESLGIPFPWAAYLIGLGATAILAWFGFVWLRRATGDRAAALAASLLLVSTHPFPWSAVSGMEPPLAAVLVIAVAVSAPGRAPLRCLSLAAAAALVRPELILLPAVILADYLLKARPLKTRSIAPVAIGTLAASIAPLLFTRLFSGTYLPGSFRAKVGHHGIIAALMEHRPDQIMAVLASNLPSFVPEFLHAVARDNLPLLLLAPLGFRRLARGASGSHLPWLLFVVQPCAMAVLAPFGGPEFHEQRYVAPLVAVALAAGCAALPGLPGWSRSATLRYGGVLCLLGVSAAGAARGMTRYGLEVKNITEMQVSVGRWLAARGTSLSLVATNDIGAIGFITRAPILDLTGLATPEIIPYLRRPASPGRRNRGWNGANETALLEFLRERRPDYVAIFPSWYPSPFFRAALGKVDFSVDLKDNLICGDSTMIVYRPSWVTRRAGSVLASAPDGRVVVDRAGGRLQAARVAGPDLAGGGDRAVPDY